MDTKVSKGSAHEPAGLDDQEPLFRSQDGSSLGHADCWARHSDQVRREPINSPLTNVATSRAEASDSLYAEPQSSTQQGNLLFQETSQLNVRGNSASGIGGAHGAGSGPEASHRCTESMSADSCSDIEDRLYQEIFKQDIPGFPLPPPLIPTPSIAASPPPNVPCPLLPETARKRYPANSLLESEQRTAALTGGQQVNLHKKGTQGIRDGDDAFPGLEVDEKRHLRVPRGCQTQSNHFDLDTEFSKYSSSPEAVPPFTATNILQCLPNFSPYGEPNSADFMFRHPPTMGSSPGKDGELDTFVGQNVPAGSLTKTAPANVIQSPTFGHHPTHGRFSIRSNEALISQVMLGPSTTIPEEIEPREQLDLNNPHIVETLRKLEGIKTGNGNPEEGHNFDPRHIMSVALDDNTNGVSSGTNLNDHIHREASNPPSEAGIELQSLPNNDLNTPRLLPVDLIPVIVAVPTPFSTAFTYTKKRVQKFSQAVKERLDFILKRKLLYNLLLAAAIMTTLAFLLGFLVAYPAGMQKYLDHSDLSLYHMNITNVSAGSFVVGLDLALANTGGLSGTLQPMALDIKASSPAREYDPYLHTVQMPPIKFTNDMKAKLISVNNSSVLDQTDEWGDILAKVFARENDAALRFHGKGTFTKGGMHMQLHLRKSIPLVSHSESDMSKSGILEWHLVYDEATDTTTLFGHSQFPNPSNLTLFMGDVTFDLIHRNIAIGVLKVPNYQLVPGLNENVNFSAVLNHEAFEADRDLRGSFLSTLMLRDSAERNEDFMFRIVGNSSSIDGVEIPWLSKAVQGISDDVLMLSNAELGKTDISRLVTDVRTGDFHIVLSDLIPHENVYSTNISGGYLSVRVNYPVASDFRMDMMFTTHEWDLVDPQEGKVYAKIEVTESDMTTSWTGSINFDDGFSYSVRTEKHLSASLIGSRLTITNREAFAEHFLRPMMNDAVVRVLVEGKVWMQVESPLGRCTLEPILFSKIVGIVGMGILQQSVNPVEITNVEITKGYQKGVEEFPHLEMNYDMNVRNDGDLTFEFGDMVFDMMHNEEVIGKSRIDNFTLVPGINTFRGVCDLGPYHAGEYDTYFRSPILANMISGIRTPITLAGKTDPLGVSIGQLRRNHYGLPAEIRSARRVIIDSMEINISRDIRPTDVSLRVMNPFKTEIGVSYIEGNITAKSSEVKNRHFVTISSQSITYRGVAAANGTEIHRVDVPGITANPLYRNELTKDDLFGEDYLDIMIKMNLGINIGGFTALIPYTSMGRKTSVALDGEGGGRVKFIFVGGVTVTQPWP